MPEYVVNKLVLALNERGRAMKGSKILILGLAYKKDIDDPRESPAFEVVHALARLARGRGLSRPARAPRAAHALVARPTGARASQPLTAEVLAAHDATIVVTDHSAVDYELVARHAPLIVDTRGVYRAPRPNVIKA